ncbi:hypothetical protein [Moraxella bovis]|uniref:Uncharacterized protein n=1 Tax=Moraxella bovis TaxID=476 RepID=A0AAQ2T201_MORBO|nr:hypothetical protein [Moraxella bovis]AWY19719.1 hypothetical protein DQF64_03865 [Moraxella bovis]OOR91989.1 hypothetical protein B0182_02110 [Moraxella bovis]UYZ75157.1 hypothetical protein LP093_10370 [Moraxella bovis]UYZ78911.1 hypothetical protein LP115_03480 [Moraxella bovis]UYZ87394.1 hypothetical protein LP094_03495 [Moraxella bovis]
MATKKEILAYAKQHGFIYPKIKVIFGFGLLGGMIGGIMFCCIGFMIETTYEQIINHISHKGIISLFLKLPFYILGFAFLGAWAGGIPAFLTGIYLSFKNFIFIDKKDYVKIFAIGFLITSIFALLMVVFSNQQPNMQITIWDFFLISFPLAIIGGISAMICGKLFLPKLPNNF